MVLAIRNHNVGLLRTMIEDRVAGLAPGDYRQRVMAEIVS